MKRKLLLVFCFIMMLHWMDAQDSIVSRVIFIGDAGEINEGQHAVIENASRLIIPGKTTVVYLGDNIYPKGFALSGNEEIERSGKIIQSQFVPTRNKGATVYFIPGNHDWDRSGLNGLSKTKQQWAYINAQQDSMLKLVPANGCPDPYEIDVSDSLTIIAFDSEWWLFPFDKTNLGAECSCKSTKDITDRLEQILYENRYKVILLASHHPFQSFGNHGGYFSLKGNIFPLTALNRNLYIPLPLVGSLYPILRTTFPDPEDLGHPLYRTMIKNIDDVFAGFPNLVHVAGHEHGLQFIKDKQIQVVSGSASKDTYLRKNKNALFEKSIRGFVVADLLTGNNLRFSYYKYTDSANTASFTYTQPYKSIKYREDSVRAVITTDSVSISVHSAFDKVNGLHRVFFGENYRKEWAAVENLPVIRISDFRGGLKPIKRGGGNQTHSLRLEDKDGNEWALRSVEKYPDVVLPEKIRETFAKDIVIDAMSAQHPYSALVVPVLADAVHVPHSNPIIGLVAPDKALGFYSKTFENKVCLLEEREPLGKSDNFTKMLNELSENNDNRFDSKTFLRARLLDIFLGDWDRHGDQWRFVDDSKKGKGKWYVPIPRDRDQVFYTNQGIFPWYESRPWIQPFFEGFNPKIRNAGTFFFSSTMLNVRLINHFSYDEWMSITHEFVSALTDSILELSLKKLPANSYRLGHDKLISIMKKRRDNLPRAMSSYYKFMYKNAFIQVSDKNEFVEIKDAANNGTQIVINKISKKGEKKDTVFSNTYYPDVTKEVRLFLGNGDDSVIVNAPNSPIKVRISGTDGEKMYNMIHSDKKVAVFGKKENMHFSGDAGRFKKHLSNDTLNTAIVPGSLFNVITPVLTGGFNLDDGFLLGAGLVFTHNIDYTVPGFSTKRYSSVQQFIVTHSFSTNAFNIRYNGEWLKAIGKADFTLKADILAPDNTQNYFGTGNETEFDKIGNYKKYYRVRFALYDAAPALRWGNKKGTYLSVGPTIQYYHFDSSDNKSRVIQNTSLIRSYDSITVDKNKVHAGVDIGFVNDRRNNKLIPQWGSLFDMHISGNVGLNTYSKSFVRVSSAIAFYKSLNAKSSIILAERLGGEAIFGNAAFYQSAFLGGQGNLLGFRQYRFAGQYMLYNNLELRIRLANFASYILPGEFGLIGTFDIGRVWEKNDRSGLCHNGYGGGFYFSPAQLIVIRAVAANSVEGFYPYIALGLRF